MPTSMTPHGVLSPSLRLHCSNADCDFSRMTTTRGVKYDFFCLWLNEINTDFLIVAGAANLQYTLFAFKFYDFHFRNSIGFLRLFCIVLNFVIHC